MNALHDYSSQLICLGVAAAILFLFIIPIARRIQVHYNTPAEDDDHHEVCENCGYDARGLDRCPECGQKVTAGRRQKLAKLRDDWPKENIPPREPGKNEPVVVILTTANGSAVELLRQHLQARGIAAELDVVEDAKPSGKDRYRLAVWWDDKERAKEIVAQLWPEN